MESCDSPVKIIVGGKTWYYQKFYDERGKVSAVNLYDGGGDFVREYRNIYQMTGSLGAMVRKEKKKEAEKMAKEVKKWDEEWKNGGSLITREEKEENQRVFMERFASLKGGLSAGEFASALGISVGAANNYLSGVRFPSGHMLKKIATRMGVTVDWLLGRE